MEENPAPAEMYEPLTRICFRFSMSTVQTFHDGTALLQQQFATMALIILYNHYQQINKNNKVLLSKQEKTLSTNKEAQTHDNHNLLLVTITTSVSNGPLAHFHLFRKRVKQITVFLWTFPGSGSGKMMVCNI